MTNDQRFMSADGVPLPYLKLNEAGVVTIPPDTFSAIRVVLAAMDADENTMLEVLQEQPTLPLLGGLISLVLALGDKACSGRLREHLDGLALVSSDPSADVFRKQRSRS